MSTEYRILQIIAAPKDCIAEMECGDRTTYHERPLALALVEYRYGDTTYTEVMPVAFDGRVHEEFSLEPCYPFDECPSNPVSADRLPVTCPGHKWTAPATATP
jgi:hypothetical protein